MLAVSYQVMLVKATNQARNVAEFVAAARQRPRRAQLRLDRHR